ncbi:Fpg/Nei family DNA glycosylase [Bacillus horti]|uniref:Formamidopyrimidine-DNA glycosylase n=1 Tax=Caldalkalibacillus horti TaxID=77523 RepID=A0ABT9W318_9BACI|nr:DNA-formamidopyrimidine glycosylase family protein [Bacillus horti]MDQ0167639.1 formamidopyrimidine-DNA glycosylase [Bacillus horti]
MPELPEMENYRILLSQIIVNQRIVRVQINREKSINVEVERFHNAISHQKVIRIERRAKHLLFNLENGNILLLHLMLGGWMYFGSYEDKPDRTVQIQLTFPEGELYFIGLRLGYLHLYPSQMAVNQKLIELGPEPLESGFTLSFFESYIQGKRGRLKTVLVDQSFLSGIGNCYSDEICFAAQLLPKRDIAKLSDQEIKRLYHSIQKVLTDATAGGGYMEHPLYKSDKQTGAFDERCMIYDREGEPCQRCGSPIVKEMLSSRKMFFCVGCQI